MNAGSLVSAGLARRLTALGRPPFILRPFAFFLRRAIVRKAAGRLPPKLRRVLVAPRIHQAASTPSGAVVCLISHSLVASGAPKVVFDLAVDLLAAGYAPVVISPFDGPYRSILVSAGIPVIVDRDVTSPMSRSLQFMTDAFAVICNTVHCRKVVLALAYRVPVFWYMHEALAVADFARSEPAFRASLQSAKEVWAVSEMAATYLRPFRSDVGIVTPGTAPLRDNERVPSIVPQAIVKLGVFAGLEPRKGQDLLFRAFQNLDPSVRERLDITLFGEVLDSEYAQTLMRETGGIANFRYAGGLAPGAVADKIIEMDGVVVPSRDEPLPLVAVEVLSISRVLLCSKRCGIADYLTDGVDAFVAEDCSSDALALMLHRAISQKARWPEIAFMGYRRYQSSFTRNHMSSKVISSIQRISPTPLISP